MNRDDIIRMALESGFSRDFSGVYHSCGGSGADSDLTLPLERFAALVAAAEREECAKVCEGVVSGWIGDTWVPSSARCAAAIRARGEA